MKEETFENNGQFICSDCIDEELKKIDHSKIRNGDIVKSRFIAQNKKENIQYESMWVEITKIHSKRYTGILLNNPFWVKDLKYLDIVHISKNDVWGLLPKESN